MKNEKKMNILILATSGFPIPAVEGGAIENLVQNIIDENEIYYKYNFTVVTLEFENSHFYDTKYIHTKFIRFKKRKTINRIYFRFAKYVKKILCKELIPFTYQWEAYRFLKKNCNNYDYILAESGMTEIGLLKNINSKKVILHIHGLGEIKKSDNIPKNIIFVSEFCKKQWLERYPQTNANLYVLKNCIDIEKFNNNLEYNEKNDMIYKLKISKSSYVILFSGRLIQEKGIKELILAVNKLKDKSICLLIAGGIYYSKKYKKNQYYNELIKLAKESQSKIVFLGYINYDEIWKYYIIADLSIVPSIWQEPAGLVVLEGQSVGKPIIVTNSGGIPEYLGENSGVIIENDKNIVENLARSISNFKNNPMISRIYGNNGKEWSKLFDKKAYFNNFNKIIRDIETK